MENQYEKSLSEKEKKALQIAKDHLGSSFDITKSNGFMKAYIFQQNHLGAPSFELSRQHYHELCVLVSDASLEAESEEFPPSTPSRAPGLY